MSTYLYTEDCGEVHETFDAATDDDAIAHAEREFRQHPDADGDTGHLHRLETDEDGQWWEGVTTWEGENMIADPEGLRFR